MALKRAKQVEGTIKADDKGGSPVATLTLSDSRTVRKYNLAVAAVKRAQKAVKAFNEELQPKAQAELFRLNVEAKLDKFKSIKVVDSSSAAVRVTMQDKYSVIQPAIVPQVEALFDEIHLDINDFLMETSVPVFDTSVLLKADGTLDLPLYNAMRDAIKIAIEEIRPDTKVPLEVSKVVTVKSDFNTKRFEKLDVEQNKKVSELITNTITFTALADEG